MPVTFQHRPSETRGGADHGWLKTFHTFSFADWYNPAYQQFGCLRVINEDRVTGGTGFPTHPHREFEIFSYIISGELSHKDSMGNTESMKRGDVQMTSGGTGIRHSEYNDDPSIPVHFLQIWAQPSTRGLKPQYYTRHFTDEEKLNKIVTIVAPVGSSEVVDEREAKGPTPVHAPLYTFATLLEPSTSVTHALHDTSRGPGEKLFYAQLVQSAGYNTKPAPSVGASASHVKISHGSEVTTLGEGDGVFIRGAKTGDAFDIESIGQTRAELVLFEMDA